MNGKVIDVTLRDCATREPILGRFTDRHYIGISFETRLVRAEMVRRTAAWPLLEDATALKLGIAGLVIGVERERIG